MSVLALAMAVVVGVCGLAVLLVFAGTFMQDMDVMRAARGIANDSRK